MALSQSRHSRVDDFKPDTSGMGDWWSQQVVEWWIELCGTGYHVCGIYGVGGLCGLGWGDVMKRANKEPKETTRGGSK
jgi:hypothetical protein